MHQPILSGRAGAAQVYPPELCRAIVRGLIKEKRERVLKVKPVVEIVMPLKSLRRKAGKLNMEEFHEVEGVKAISGALAFDDLTGMALDRQKVMEARQKEIGYVNEKEVYVRVPRKLAMSRGWKVIKTRWIDINKDDDLQVVYRSRLVAKEYNDNTTEGLFAGTPPLEALRYILHEKPRHKMT